jgi:hypothetical protein
VGEKNGERRRRRRKKGWDAKLGRRSQGKVCERRKRAPGEPGTS